MLLQCAGPCSTKCIENNWQDIGAQCALDSMEVSLDEYIVFLFANRYQLHKNKNYVQKE